MNKEKKKILHMDNEEDTLSSVKTILEKEGFEVTSVTRGQKAIDLIEGNGFDLVLLDIMMPDLSGWDVFTRLMKTAPNIKVIFLSVLEISTERKKQLSKHGVADYILKPFDRADLVRRVKAALYEGK